MTRHSRNRAATSRRALVIAAFAAVLLLSSGSVQAETLTIAAVNFRFEPETRTAAVGDVVRWTFAGDPHTVTSGPPGAPDGRFDSGIKDPGDTYQLTLTTAGTFRYFCAIHPEQMFGTLVVSGASDATPKPTAEPTTRPTPRPTPRPSVAATARPTVRPTPTAAAAPTGAPTPGPSTTPFASASATSSLAPSPTASPERSSPTAGGGGSPIPDPSTPPDPGRADSSADPAPIVAAAIVLVVLVGGGLGLARRAGRI